MDLQRPSKVVDMVGIGGTQQVLVQAVDTLTLDGVTVKDFSVEFGDFDGKFPLKGIIGGDLLKQLGAKIDYRLDELSCTSGA